MKECSGTVRVEFCAQMLFPKVVYLLLISC
jgi:hypothetical protein